MSNIYYGFGRIFMGKEYDFCMSHYRARYKSEEISPLGEFLTPCFVTKAEDEKELYNFLILILQGKLNIKSLNIFDILTHFD